MKVEANKTYVGIVEDNMDPLKLGRCRVRVLDVFDDLKVEDIPFATAWKDLNGNSVNIPEKGKVLLVVFDQGDKYKPEFISSDHYNINLEKKLSSLNDLNYTSMKSILFDHKTQIYVNDIEGLKLDHKYNNLNITENTIDLNLKDNNVHLNLGDATATQQSILGNHWMDWFDEFVDNLIGNNGGPYLGNLGSPVVANPGLIAVLQKYKQLRDPVFLSHHVNVVDNNKISTVKNTKREDNPQIGDSWNSTKVENNLTTITNDNFKPVDGPKPEYNDKHVETPVVPSGLTGASSSVLIKNTILDNIKPENINPPLDPLSSPKSNPKIDKLISFLKSKDYIIYDDINILNIVALRSSKKDNGDISNKFDDTLCVFFKNNNNNWNIFEYQITTMPGFLPKTEILPNGVAMLALGQYVEQGRLDFYQNDKEHKCIKMNETVIHINDNQSRYNYKSNTSTGKFPLSIHRSSDKGSSENVYNYSEGSQVFKNITQYNQFITFCENQSKIKNLFTYTICRESDFNKFIPDVINISNNIIKSSTEVNTLANWNPGKLVNSNILTDNDIIIEWVIVNGFEFGSYKGTLKSEKGRDIKLEEFTSKDLKALENLIREEAIKDLNELKSQ